MPISWRGTLAQYAGRLHRLHGSKRDVIIYDYVDENEPMLAKMAAKREALDPLIKSHRKTVRDQGSF
jgi:superfamily II DNA or RNA helicase